MYKLLLMFLLGLGVANLASADDKTDVVQTATRFIDAYNKEDSVSLIALCSDQPSIVFDVAPFEWHGAGACARWLQDGMIENKTLGITDVAATLHTPLHVMFRQSDVYVVSTIDFHYRTRSTPGEELGSYIVFALQKREKGWVITAMTLALR